MPHPATRSTSPKTRANGSPSRVLMVLAAGASALVLASGSSALADDPVGDNLDPHGPRSTCQGESPTIFAGPDRATVEGTPGDDVILASGGKHSILAMEGDDLICTDGPGRDEVDGGPGNDRIYTDGGSDGLYGGPGNDQLNSGGGDDRIFGRSGNDGAYGGSGRDFCFNAAAHSCGSMFGI